MPYLAQAQVLGHLGRDIESKFLPSGKELHEFSVAVTEKRGQDKITSWFTAKVWGELPTWKRDELHKGALVLVTGRLGVETWEGKDGKQGSKVVITANPFDGVTVFGKREEDAGGIVSQPRSAAPAQEKKHFSFEPLGVGDDSEVPF